ncbi:MAG: hypothetical protein ACF8MJ_06580, partial [Phycisphaerales bacterium JB050]
MSSYVVSILEWVKGAPAREQPAWIICVAKNNAFVTHRANNHVQVTEVHLAAERDVAGDRVPCFSRVADGLGNQQEVFLLDLEVAGRIAGDSQPRHVMRVQDRVAVLVLRGELTIVTPAAGGLVCDRPQEIAARRRVDLHGRGLERRVVRIDQRGHEQ